MRYRFRQGVLTQSNVFLLIQSSLSNKLLLMGKIQHELENTKGKRNKRERERGREKEREGERKRRSEKETERERER